MQTHEERKARMRAYYQANKDKWQKYNRDALARMTDEERTAYKERQRQLSRKYYEAHLTEQATENCLKVVTDLDGPEFAGAVLPNLVGFSDAGVVAGHWVTFPGSAFSPRRQKSSSGPQLDLTGRSTSPR